jgi:methanogenic corrinoid protein MtbC1
MFAIVKDMLKSVYNLNELSLSDMLEVAFEMYPVRVVCADIIAPMMWEIGSMWERGEIMVVMEHFASSIFKYNRKSTFFLIKLYMLSLLN